MHKNIIGLKEFRENVETFAKKVSRGDSFIIVRRSKPLFKIVPLEHEADDGQWETVIDFTKIRKGGIPAEVLLKYLRNGQNRKKSKKV